MPATENKQKKEDLKELVSKERRLNQNHNQHPNILNDGLNPIWLCMFNVELIILFLIIFSLSFN